MATTYSKTCLSGSTNGKQILITASGTATAQTVHTAVAGASSWDEIWIYAYSQSGATDVTICWGGTDYPNDYMTATVPIRSGRNLIVDGKLLQNGLTISAFTSAGTLQLDGFVNQITVS